MQIVIQVAVALLKKGSEPRTAMRKITRKKKPNKQMVYRPMDQPTNAPYGEMLGCLLTTKNNKSATKSYAVKSPSNHHTARPVQCQKSIDEKRNKRILFQNQRAATQLQRPSRMAIHKGKEQSETRVEPSILIENELEEIGLSLITPAQASAKEVSRGPKERLCMVVVATEITGCQRV